MTRKPYQWKSKSRLGTNTHSTFRERPKRASTLKACGKKAKLRETINRRNRARFRAMGLYDVCEAKLPNCWNTDLTWSHGKKDRKLTMSEREFLVIRCCSVCHRQMDEEMSPEKMLKFTESVIANRKVAA